MNLVELTDLDGGIVHVNMDNVVTITEVIKDKLPVSELILVTENITYVKETANEIKAALSKDL